MAQTIAPAEPITLDAAFSDQAQRTDEGCRSSNRVRPIGNGMPIAKPAGAISSTVTEIFTHNGQPTPPASTGATTAAIIATSATTAQRAIDNFPWDRPIKRRLQKLPIPLDSSIEKITTVSAYVGLPRNSTNFCISAISTRMYP